MHRLALFLALLVVATVPALAADELVVLETARGNVRLRLLPDKAPHHVENFQKLVRSGFYDGTTFHRVIPGYIIQGGSPTSRDTDTANDNFGTPGYAIKAEFNDQRHTRGAVSMARSVDDPDSAGAQFFIMLGDAPELDEIRFTIFARVIDGMDVADVIAAQPRDESNHDRPLEPVVIRRARLDSAAAGSVATTARDQPGEPPSEPPTASASVPAPPPGRAPETSGTGETVRVKEKLVNIRRSASTSGDVLQRVPRGTDLVVDRVEGQWYRVKLSDGQVGYIRNDMVE